MKTIKENYIEIFFILFLITLVISSSDLIRDSALTSILWHSDDAIHLSAAKSISEGRESTIDFAPWWGTLSTEELINNYPNISSIQNGKGPIYYLVLAGVFNLVSPESEFYYIGSIFNTILTIFLVTIYFVFCRIYFSRTVTFMSSLVISILPVIMLVSVRVVPHMLSFIFIILAFIFMKKNYSNYFLFGIFSGLAHLTHPLGVIASISYSLFLLLKKEFRGALIVFATSSLMLLPWFIRNLLVFGNLGEGLGIPFGTEISNLLGFEQKRTLLTSELIAETNIDPVLFFKELFIPLHGFYHMNLVLALVGIGLLIILLFFIFKIPSKKFFKYFLENKNLQRHRLALFSLVFVFVTILASYYVGIVNGWVPDTRNILPIFFLLIPFGAFGLERLVTLFTKNKSIKKLPITILVLMIFVTPIAIFELFESYDEIIQYNEVKRINQFSTNNLNKWISSNIIKNSIISTNYPHLLYIQTGFTSIGIPNDLAAMKTIDKYLNHYKPDYVVWYGEPRNKFNANPTPTYYFQGVYGEISDDSPWRFDILKVEKQTEEHLKEKISEYLALGQYSQALEGYNLIVVFYDREIDQLKKSGQLDNANTVQLSLESITKERYDFVFTAADSNKKIIQKLVESNQYFEAMKVFDETIDFLEIYVIQPEIINQEKKVKIQQLIEEFEIGQHRSLMTWDELLRKEVPILLDLKDDEEAIEFYKSLRDYYQKKYITFEKSGNFNDAKKIKNSLVEYVGYNAKLFMDHEMLYDAERAYLFLINIDKYDRKVWTEFGELYEKMGRLSQALDAYTKANFLPDKDYTDKIEELKNKLES